MRSYTIQYSSHKRRVETRLKNHLTSEIEQLQAIPPDCLTTLLLNRVEYLQLKLRDLQRKEIAGYIVRARLPRFEDKEPSIQKYARMAKSRAKSTYISLLTDDTGQEMCTIPDLLRVTHSFYSKLYTPRAVHLPTQAALLNNLTARVTASQKLMLDSPITLLELTTAVFQLPLDKTPGADGIPIEFYRHFWPLLQDRYLAYLTAAYDAGFPSSRNLGLLKLLYKDRGSPHDLSNYRPIALLNCDTKILTRTLANRFRLVLPTIIHKSQTAVPGRRIDTTVHTIRDLIQLAENNNMNAAFLFLDQEKAFDRVNHALLFKAMRRYNIGDPFIRWVEQLYADAQCKVMLNGYFTDPLPLRCGVRQGCPLSPLLYVLVIELLAAQLRSNPNIVGFTVGGEKIISLHYADDTTITITQNRCFKEVIKDDSCFNEVIKDLRRYEYATGAKI